MKPYPSYKDSGIAWIGQIPSHWEVSRVASLYTENTSKNTDNEFAYAMRFNYGTLVDKNEAGDVSDLKETYSAYTKVKKNDVVINGLNLNYDFNSLRVAISPKEGIITSAYIIMSPRPGTNSTFYNYLFKSMDSRKIFHGMGTGIRLTLSFAELKKQALIVPPADEQEAIVRYITEKSEKIDRYIAEQQRLLAALDELRQAEIARAVTRGLNPEAPLRDSGIDWIGSIPAHWEINRIKTHFYHISGNGFKIEFQGQTSGDFPFCKASDINGRNREVNTAANYVSKELALQEGYNIIPTGSILFAKIGEALKKNHRKVNTCDCVVDNNCSALTRKADSNINILYFYYISLLLDMATFDNGGTIPCVNISKLLSCQIPIPPLPEQRAIVEYLDEKTVKIDRMKADIEKQIGLLKEYKQRMISDAVTGKIDVRE